jgi:hypothetical protein
MSKKSNSKTQTGPSLADLADSSLKEISKYAQSDDEADKLIGFNVILAFLVLTFLIAGYLLPANSDLFVSIIYVFVSGIFALILSYGYLRIIEIIANLISKNFLAIRISITFLFFIVSISLIGFLYHLKELLNVGFALLIVQILILIGLGFVIIPGKSQRNQDTSKGADTWAWIGRTSDICGVINFIVWIGVIVWKALGY